MSTQLAVIDDMSGVELFAPGKYRDILDGYKAEVRSVPVDISTPKGREECASLAYSVGKTKNAIDKKRKALVEDEKKRLKAIDAEGSRIWDELEDLQKEVRKPLTDWENYEKDRVAAHEHALTSIPEGAYYGATETSQEIKFRLEYLSDLFASRDWQEFKNRAKQAIDAEIVRTQGILTTLQKREAEAEELAKLRAEQIAREQCERDERIAQEARVKAEQAAEVERKRIEQEKFQAEARAKEAEARERAAAEQAERDRIAAVEAEKQHIAKAEADRVAAEERHAREKAEAIKAERARQEADAKRIKEEAEARERNKQHAAKINREVRDAIASCADINDEQATRIVLAIAKGLIPHCKVAY